MFPENWSLERIQEEVAWVYENTVAKGNGLNPNSLNKKYKQYKYFDSTGKFEILLEVDESLNIVNSYPIIN